MSLSKAEILGADDTKIEKLSVPEWGGHVHIRTWSGTERDAFEASCQGANGTMNIRGVRARLGCMSICDKTGKRLFSDSDLVMLGDKSGIALDRVLKAVQSINMLSDDDVEELAKNSEGGPAA